MVPYPPASTTTTTVLIARIRVMAATNDEHVAISMSKANRGERPSNKDISALAITMFAIIR